MLLPVLLRIPLLAASLLLPGWLILRACGLRTSLAAAFPLSAAMVYVVAVTLALLSVKLSLFSVGIALVALCAGIALVARKRAPSQAEAHPETPRPPGTIPGWVMGFLAVSVALFAWRATVQPLTGPDTPFRWNYLALELVRTGELTFYPSRTLADFERYFYADGFPPLVAIQYWWTYVVLGTESPQATGLIVTAQFAAMLGLVAAVGSRLANPAAGLIAALALALSGLVFWTFLLGQETGWIALGVVASLWCWSHAGDNTCYGPALAAACALLPALVAREYGPALLFVGGLLALQTGARWRSIAIFAVAAVLLAAPWYLQVWARCGNPFYSLSPFGLFPTNPTVDGLLESYRERFAILDQRPGLLAYRAADFVVNSPLLAVAVVGALWGWRRHWRALAAAALIVGLWYQAAALTSGGLHIANRVLVPGLVVAAIVAVQVWVRQAPALLRSRFAAGAIAIAAVWSLYVNAAPPAALEFLAPREWWACVRDVKLGTPIAVSAIPAHALAPGERIASDDAYFHARERAAGFRHPVVPFWADELRFLLSRHLTAAEAARQLRALNIGIVHLERVHTANWPYWQTRPFFATIVDHWPRVENPAGLELRRVPPVSENASAK